MQTVELSIQGMHCGGCASKVKAALESVPGAEVENVAVGSARILFDPTKTSTVALIGVVDRLGFKAAASSGKI